MRSRLARARAELAMVAEDKDIGVRHYRQQFARAEAAEAHIAEHARLLDAASDRIGAQDALLARITELHSHDNLTGCCLTCGRAGPCKTTRILTGEST